MSDNPLRIFKIWFADARLEKINKVMRKFDVGWGPEDGACMTGTIKSRTIKSLEQYASELKKYMATEGWNLYDIKECI